MNNNDDNINENKINQTREINLDDLYDGAINNTVVIDPITKNEVLLKQKKNNTGLIVLIIFILLVLVLYYIYTKSDLNLQRREVSPKSTTTRTTKIITREEENGKLLCSYTSKTDSEDITINYEAKYENKKIIISKYNYSLISKLDKISSIANGLKEEYENYYINNASIAGHNVVFESSDKGFSFSVETLYNAVNFDSIKVENDKTKFYIKPKESDTYETVKNELTLKGYSCSIEKDD